jgi:uncharacterized membrane protein YkoI
VAGQSREGPFHDDAFEGDSASECGAADEGSSAHGKTTGMNVSTKSTLGRALTALRTSRRARKTLCASFAALSLSSAASALAEHELLPSNDEAFAIGASFAPEDCPTARTVQRGGISLSQASAIAQSRVPGRVVSAKTVMAGDRVIHEIRILGDDGRVRTVRVDAQSGAVM